MKAKLLIITAAIVFGIGSAQAFKKTTCNCPAEGSKMTVEIGAGGTKVTCSIGKVSCVTK